MPRATRKAVLPESMLATLAAPTGEAPKKSAALYKQTVFDQFLDMMGRIPDPDQILKAANIKRQDLSMLETDDDLSAALDTRREAVLGTAWRIEPGGTEQAEWLESELRPQMENMLRCCLQAVPYGYSVGEIIYRTTPEGRLGVDTIVQLPIEWFSPRADGALIWFSQTNPQGEVVDPAKFMLTIRQATYRNPMGEALLSRLYWPWFFRKNGWMFWAKWLERFGQPLLLGKTKGNFEKMAKDLHDAVQGASLAIHTDDDVKAIDSTGTGSQFVEFESHLIRRYQRTILGQTLTSDVGDSGSYAAAAVHDEVRQDKRNADLRLCMTSVQKLVNTLWILNAFPDVPPEFVMADETGLEPERAERDKKLVEAKIIRLTKDYMLDRYDFREGDFEMVEEATPAPDMPPDPNAAPGAAQDATEGQDKAKQDEEDEGKPPKGEAFAFAPSSVGLTRFTKGQQAVENLVSTAMSELGPLVSQAAILRSIRLSTSPEDLMERLALLYEDGESPGFRRVFEQALFAAEVMGYAHAEDPEAVRFSAPTINVTAQFEPPPAPTITVNVPPQEPPVVNVTNEITTPEPVVNLSIEPAPVTVQNTVTVPPRTTETIIERDADGNIVKATQQDIPDERTLN